MSKVRCNSLSHGSAVAYHDTVDDVRVCTEIDQLWRVYDEIMWYERGELMDDSRSMDIGKRR